MGSLCKITWTPRIAPLLQEQTGKVYYNQGEEKEWEIDRQKANNNEYNKANQQISQFKVYNWETTFFLLSIA